MLEGFMNAAEFKTIEEDKKKNKKAEKINEREQKEEESDEDDKTDFYQLIMGFK